MSITIRTKEGQEIDLDSVRERARHILADEISYSMGQCASAKRELGLVDALEAALSVPGAEEIDVENQWDTGYEKGFNDALTFVRKAAGVIENPA